MLKRKHLMATSSPLLHFIGNGDKSMKKDRNKMRQHRHMKKSHFRLLDSNTHKFQRKWMGFGSKEQFR